MILPKDGLADNRNTDKIKYNPGFRNTQTDSEISVAPIGIDTEAYPNGRCFMIATSLGDVFKMSDFPNCLFSRKYRGKTFVAYNLKYDSGALLQCLPKSKLTALWKDGKTEQAGFRYRALGYKYLGISKGKNAIHFYDMLNFYECKLETAAATYLDEHKQDIDPKLFTRSYVRSHWQEIASYCVQDAVLVCKLAERLIHKLEAFGVYPKKLYSVAYVSYQYFKSKCFYVTVKRFWKRERELLQYALAAYNGGKFEVTKKGVDYYYEYDIVSAYPFQIANLLDISTANVEYSRRYEKDALYGFLLVRGRIDSVCFSPTVVKRRNVCCYPVGQIRRVVTKEEYEYLLSQNCDLSIEGAVWLRSRNRQYPYRREIHKLVKLKGEIKKKGDDFDYHTIKILLNSLYGKFVQLIKKGKRWEASACWNPIYAAIITANCRIEMCRMQKTYASIVAVHTDSVISTTPLPYNGHAKLGDFEYKREGQGVILGSGIYQIGKTVKFRGFEKKRDLFDLFKCNDKVAKVSVTRPHSWRLVMAMGWDTEKINLFETRPRKLKVNFDQKRMWYRDWQKFSDIPKRQVESVPLVNSKLLF